MEIAEEYRKYFNGMLHGVVTHFSSLIELDRAKRAFETPVIDEVVEAEQGFRCHICNQVETSQSRLNQHLARSHQIRNPVNKKISETYCRHCKLELHNVT